MESTPTQICPKLALSMRTERLIVGALHRMRVKYRAGEPVTFADLFAPLGPRAAALGSALVAAPFILPISLGPFTAPASLLIICLGIGLIVGGNIAAHPEQHRGMPKEGRVARMREKILATPFPERVHKALSSFARNTVTWKRRVCRARLTMLVDGPTGQILCGVGLLFGAVLLAVPLPMIPLGNTFPALAIVFCAIGWTERDGLLVILGWFFALLSVAYFTLVAFIGADIARWIMSYFS